MPYDRVMQDPWFPFVEPSSRARIRLFCIPPAGGSARLFLSWRELLPAHIALYAVELPGRGARLGEAPFKSVSSLLEVLGPAVMRHCNVPYALFGHSMGGLLAYELACQLRGNGVRPPLHLFVSGARAPHLPDRAWCHTLPDDALIAALREMGGFPDEVLSSAALMQMLLPVIRADAELTERYAHIERPPLDCPLKAVFGEDDKLVPREQVEAWHGYTRGPFSVADCPGGHDFLSTFTARVAALVSETLSLRTL